MVWYACDNCTFLCSRVRKNLRMHVGDLDVAAVACGLGRTIGNKVRHLAANAPLHDSCRLCI